MEGADSRLSRVAMLVGQSGVDRLAQARVIVFGLGGVGSWAVEALARTGVGRLTIVDPDIVAPSNINRQLPALVTTVGRPKAAVMAERIALVNPEASVEAVAERYTGSWPGLGEYDVIIDAIDSLADKADLIIEATALPGPSRFFSSMGAAGRVDASRVTVSRFDRVQGDALARALRNRFKRTGRGPRRPFMCVHSTEPRLQEPAVSADAAADGTMTFGKHTLSGALCPVTATFGMQLASLAIGRLLARPE